MFLSPACAGDISQAVSEADGKGAATMNVATVLRVFKNSSLITEQGEYKISRIFDNGKAANKARYHYHCTEHGVVIYSCRTNAGTSKFAVAGK